MSEIPYKVRVNFVGDDYEVEVEFTAEGIKKFIEQVTQLLPGPKKEVLPSYYKPCLIHNVQMKRHVRDGNVWFSHKLPDGTWCYGQEEKV